MKKKFNVVIIPARSGSKKLKIRILELSFQNQ